MFQSTLSCFNFFVYCSLSQRSRAHVQAIVVRVQRNCLRSKSPATQPATVQRRMLSINKMYGRRFMSSRAAYIACEKDFETVPPMPFLGRLSDRGKRKSGASERAIVVRVPMKYQKNCLRSGKRGTGPPERPTTPPPTRLITPPPYISVVANDSGEDSDDSGMSRSEPFVSNYTDSDVHFDDHFDTAP